jgi:RNA polymerase sigma-70 factor (ECF subfamily)
MDDTAMPAATKPPSDEAVGIGASTRDRLVRLAYRFLWNRDEAEDVAQDALAAAHGRAAELRDPSRWWSWVSRIVVNACHERGRRRRRDQRHEAALRLRTAERSDRSGSAADDDLKEQVRRALGRLPRRQREVMVLRHLEDMPFDRIAETLGISAVTARVHARAAREALRSLLLGRTAETCTEAAESREEREEEP